MGEEMGGEVRKKQKGKNKNNIRIGIVAYFVKNCIFINLNPHFPGYDMPFNLGIF